MQRIDRAGGDAEYGLLIKLPRKPRKEVKLRSAAPAQRVRGAKIDRVDRRRCTSGGSRGVGAGSSGGHAAQGKDGDESVMVMRCWRGAGGGAGRGWSRWSSDGEDWIPFQVDVLESPRCPDYVNRVGSGWVGSSHGRTGWSPVADILLARRATLWRDT